MRARLLLGALGLVLIATAVRAETLVQTDFTAQPEDAISAEWEFNGVARLTAVEGETPPARLRMSHGDYAEKGAAWHKKIFQLSSFTAQFDVQFRPQRDGDVTPGDGLAFVLADVPTTFVGDVGGGLGLYGGSEPLAEGQVFGLDIGVYAGEGVAFAVSGQREFNEDRPGWKTLPEGVKLVDGGIWRFTLRITPSGGNSHAELFLEGGAAKLARTKIADYTSEKPVLPATGRFGFTAATGGATQFIDIYNLTVVSPAEP